MIDRVPADDTTTGELILRWRGGDRAALDRVFRRYLPALRRWAHGRLPAWARDEENTDDLVQETFVRAVQRMAQFRQERPGGLTTYLRKTLHHRLIEEVRRAARRREVHDSSPEIRAADPSALQEVLGGELLAIYEEALSRLSEESRGAVICRVEEGMSYAAIAKALGKSSPDAARMTVARALVQLARTMQTLAR